MMSPAADTALFQKKNPVLRTQETSHTNVRQNFIPTGDEFPLINQEDWARVQHLNAARNKRKCVITRHKHRTPEFLEGILVRRC
jgi:hypothetical protein